MNQPLRLAGKELPKLTDAESRQERLVKFVQESASPEDALLTCCSTSMIEVNASSSTPGVGTVAGVCHDIYTEKLSHFVAELRRFNTTIEDIFAYRAKFGEDGPEDNPHFHSLSRQVQQNFFGDALAMHLLDRVMGYAEATVAAPSYQESRKILSIRGRPNIKQRKSWTYNQVGVLIDLTLKLIDHIRGIRFFGVISNWVGGRRLPLCQACWKQTTDPAEVLLMGICGHVFCRKCVINALATTAADRAGMCPLFDRCHAQALDHSIIRLSDIDPSGSEGTDEFGAKIGGIIELIKRHEGDKFVVFVQFGRIKRELLRALIRAELPFSLTNTRDPYLRGLGRSYVKNIDVFKDCKVEDATREENEKQEDNKPQKGDQRRKGKGGARVCVLDIESEDAAGW